LILAWAATPVKSQDLWIGDTIAEIDVISPQRKQFTYAKTGSGSKKQNALRS